MRLAAAWLASALAMPAFAADDAPTADATRLASPAGLSALIACNGHPDDLLAIAPAVGDPLKAVAFGWRPLPATNMFMSEFELNAPVQVFGRSSTHIAFSGTAVMAVLDEAGEFALEFCVSGILSCTRMWYEQDSGMDINDFIALMLQMLSEPMQLLNPENQQ